jgi:hypothetical protein
MKLNGWHRLSHEEIAKSPMVQFLSALFVVWRLAIYSCPKSINIDFFFGRI